MISKRKRTPSEYIGYGLYLYFLGLSLRNVVKALSYLHIIKRSHVLLAKKWKWIQKFRYRRISSTSRNKISEYIVDETILQVGPEYIWLWVAIESENGQILAQDITQERNMLIAERFLSGVVRYYGNHPISTDGGTWYPQACEFLKMDHHIHSPLEKSLIERTMQYIKDRTECFDDYFPCKLETCKLKHVRNWLNLFADYHNKEMINA